MTKEELEQEREELSKRIEILTDELENLQDEYDELEDAEACSSLSDFSDDEIADEFKERFPDKITIVVETMKQREDLLTFVNNFIWPHYNDQTTKVF